MVNQMTRQLERIELKRGVLWVAWRKWRVQRPKGQAWVMTGVHNAVVDSRGDRSTDTT